MLFKFPIRNVSAKLLQFSCDFPSQAFDIFVDVLEVDLLQIADYCRIEQTQMQLLCFIESFIES